jgi:hypothetical protein
MTRGMQKQVLVSIGATVFFTVSMKRTTHTNILHSKKRRDKEGNKGANAAHWF